MKRLFFVALLCLVGCTASYDVFYEKQVREKEGVAALQRNIAEFSATGITAFEHTLLA